MGYNDDRADRNDDQAASDHILKKKLDTEFPLSGGETEEEWEQATQSSESGEPEDTAEFKRKLNTEFPLSGGEPGE